MVWPIRNSSALLSLILILGAASSVPAQSFVRGDANLDSSVNLADPLTILSYLFLAGSTPCLDAADADDSGTLNIADAIFVLQFLFAGGAPIPDPFPLCGNDPTPDSLGCLDNGSCPSPGPAPLPSGASYQGPALSSPRFGHTATPLGGGEVLVVGGTDMRFLNALDTLELFVENSTALPPLPDSVSGDFIDQDVDGDLMTLSGGGRFFHTTNRLEDGRVVIIGGTDNTFFGNTDEPTEIYDPLTRELTPLDPLDDLGIPRVLHTVEPLPDGRLLVIGGQEFSTVTFPVPPGTMTQNAYASVNEIEVFDPVTSNFSPLVDINGFPSELVLPRGRAGHASSAIAGFDQILGTFDDVILVVGGFETLSAASLAAPDTLVPWNNETSTITFVEFIDTTTNTVSFIPGVVLTARVNDPILINLGTNNPTTPSGTTGLANVAMVFGGDSDDSVCPADAPPGGSNSTRRSELLSAQFTGFGPANGLQVSVIPGAEMFNPALLANSNTHAFGHELALLGCTEVLRSETAGTLLPMTRSIDGVPTLVDVVVVAGGSDQRFATPCEVQTIGFCGGNQLAGFSFFDPFYDPSQVGFVLPLDDDVDNDGIPDLFPWETAGNISSTNPLGLRGSWLNFDSDIADGTIAGYATADATAGGGTVPLLSPRVFHTMTRLPGVDGVEGTDDDRLLVVGGTDGYWPVIGGLGNGPVSISCEIFVP